MRYSLTTDHEVPEGPPVQVMPGDVVEVGEKDDEWPAFVFVSGHKGSGWVPARYIDIRGARGIVHTAYDTTELPASQGESVEILEDDAESGWAWCRNSAGEEGWLPYRVLKPA